MPLDLSEQAMKTANDTVIAHRRHLHAHPELSFKETNTSQYIHDALETMGNLEISRPTKTSVIARLKGAHPGPVRAFRADIDALPIQEENSVPYASGNSGVMHACGHDGHTAMLLTAAELLTPLQNELSGEIIFMFQHAEELPPGGAEEIVASGALDDADYVVGTHLMSTIPTGQMEALAGYTHAACHEFTVTISGSGGHAARPHTSIDSVVVASAVVSNLQTIVSRRIDPMKSAVLSIPIFNGGTADNVLPDTVTLGGTLRVFDPELQEEIPKMIERIIDGITYAHGASYSLSYNRNYGAVYNNPALTQSVTECIETLFGPDAIHVSEPAMGSEDFSAYGKVAPACFVLIGSGNRQKETDYPHHHPRFDLDEDALINGVKLFYQLAFSDLRNTQQT